MDLNRRKPVQYKPTHTPRVYRTPRTEIPPETRAFIAGAALLGMSATTLSPQPSTATAQVYQFMGSIALSG
jgi:hypothetical protein